MLAYTSPTTMAALLCVGLLSAPICLLLNLHAENSETSEEREFLREFLHQVGAVPTQPPSTSCIFSRPAELRHGPCSMSNHAE
jgi:hypothetical protein